MNNPTGRTHLLRKAAWVWALSILIACLFPGNELPESNVPLADKWVHFVLFGMQAFLWLASLHRPSGKKMLTVAAGSIGFGIGVELLQALTNRWLHRAFDPMDMLANTIGVGIGVLLFLLLRKRRSPAGVPEASPH